MIGLGIDAVDIGRFRAVLQRTPGICSRVFTEDERSFADSHADPVPRLAARFAAKEATMKALGVGLGAIEFREVEVTREAGGPPQLSLSGKAAALAATKGVQQWHVSITHTDFIAEAVVAAS